MRPAAGPARWIISTLLAVAVLACLLSAAERWLWRTDGTEPRLPGAAPGAWLDLLPPPREVEATAPPPVAIRIPRREPEPAEPPWWEWAWRARAGRQAEGERVAPVHAAPDSTPLLLARLGVEPGLLARTRPDSVLAARLAWLTLREGFLPAEVRPLLRSLGRAEAYRAVAAQAASLYDEFLDQEIITPD
ncbi:MAG: hypothetical protein IPK64_11890 [bacterium]|nr:hypothetical protein [bacterium]